MTTVTFNSTKENYEKESGWKKKNTVRKIDLADPRFQITPTHIQIICRELGDLKGFTRKLTDITDFEGCRIYSW